MKHTEDTDCDVIFLKKEFIYKDKEQTILDGVVKIYKCNNHNVELCHCGIEWGKHEDYYNLLEKNANR